jgi:ATP-dependent helicase HrpB
VSALEYEGLTIEESRSGNVDADLAARLLADKAIEAGLDRFTDPEERDAFLARVAFASEHGAVPILDGTHVQHALAAMCVGLRSFAELAAAGGGLVWPGLGFPA